MIRSVMRYLRALRMCAVQAFNANQVTQHQHDGLARAVREETDAWDGLPRFVRRLIERSAAY